MYKIYFKGGWNSRDTLEQAESCAKATVLTMFERGTVWYECFAVIVNTMSGYGLFCRLNERGKCSFVALD